MRRSFRAGLAFVARHAGALLLAWFLTAALGALPWLAVPSLGAFLAALPDAADAWATLDGGWLLGMLLGPHAPLSGPPAPTPATFPAGTAPGPGLADPDAALGGSLLVLVVVPLLGWLLGPLLASLTLGRALLAEGRGEDGGEGSPAAAARRSLGADLRLALGPFYRLWAAGIPLTLASAALFAAAGAALGRLAGPAGGLWGALLGGALGAALARLAVDASRPAILAAARAGRRQGAWALFRALLAGRALPLWAALVALAAVAFVAGRLLAAAQGWLVWGWLPAAWLGTSLLLLLQQLAVLLQTALHFATAGAGTAFAGWPGETAARPAPSLPPAPLKSASEAAEEAEEAERAGLLPRA
ncbi:MAG: hypothetical protein QJR08_07640 [Bacillota bacterium]|nr:hypothetical protein [Bacillota bacterium]